MPNFFSKKLGNAHYAPISLDSGFNLKTVVTQMPESHQIWDAMAATLSDDMASFCIEERLKAMPVLHANVNILDDKYLLRASIIISGLAHAFYYPDGLTDDKPLPDSIRTPLFEIANRINKSLPEDKLVDVEHPYYIGRTYLEDFLGNFQLKDRLEKEETVTLEDIHVDKLKLLVPYFSNQDEYISTIIVGPLMQAAFAPAMRSIAMIDEELAKYEPSSELITRELELVIEAIGQVKKAFMIMSPKVGNPYYVDQVIWPQASPTIGKKVHDHEFPNTGADSPLFHVLDRFMHRKNYESVMGKNMKNRFLAVVENHQQFIEATELVGDRLFAFLQNTQNTELTNAYKRMILAYAAPKGLLDVHREKAYGYMKMSFISGRLSTNAQVKGQANTKADEHTGLNTWDRVNVTFINGMKERLLVLNQLGVDYQELEKSTPIVFSTLNLYPIPLHKIASMNKDNKVVSVYRGHVFDLSEFEQKHPGGHRIIRSLAGADITTELEQAHFFNLLMVSKMMRQYHIGHVEHSQYPEYLNNTYLHWCKVLFLISQVENNIQNIWYFDKNNVGDKARFMPFQFVMKSLDILLGENGYFDSLIQTIDTTLHAKYRARVFNYIDDEGAPLQFIGLGLWAIKQGKAEIKARGITTANGTEVNKLSVYRLYQTIILDALGFLAQLKETIITDLDVMIEPFDNPNAEDVVTSQNKRLTGQVSDAFLTFMNHVDSPRTIDLLYNPSNQSNLSQSIAFISQFKPECTSGALLITTLIAIYVGYATRDTVLTAGGASILALLALSVSTYTLSRNGFFQHHHAQREIEDTEPEIAHDLQNTF